MMHRVKKYEWTIFHPDHELISELCPFTEAQAAEIGAVLESDGLPIIHAIRLCQKWNNAAMQYPTSNNIQYSYSIPFVKKEYTDA